MASIHTEGAGDLRRALARAILGHAPDLARVALHPEAWWEMARAEGVTALLANALATRAQAPRAVDEASREVLRGAAALELSQRAHLRRVLQRLHDVGIPPLVLKGVALGQWLFPSPWLRESSDIDLLFATRGDALRAGDALRTLGYTMPYEPRPYAHEVLCRHVVARIDLDLHWELACIPALAELPSFEALCSDMIPIPSLGPQAHGLSPVDALLHACVHRASNLGAGLGDRLKWLYDIHLLSAVLDESEWNSLVERARASRIAGILRAGLEASQAMYGTIVAREAADALVGAGSVDALDPDRLADWFYVQRRNLNALPSLRAKFAWVIARAIPSTAYLRELYGHELGAAALWSHRFRQAWLRLTRLGDGRY